MKKYDIYKILRINKNISIVNFYYFNNYIIKDHNINPK